MSLPLLERLLHIRDEIQFLRRCRQKLPDLAALVADDVMCPLGYLQVDAAEKHREKGRVYRPNA